MATTIVAYRSHSSDARYERHHHPQHPHFWLLLH
jgi:hypothetical protein